MSGFGVVSNGNDNGVDRVLRYVTKRGTEIYGLGVPISYEKRGDWGLGPTWCYIIKKPPVTVIDTGQFTKYETFKTLLDKTGIGLSDIKRVIVTHGHEDHDGNLPELINDTGAEVWAHYIYRSMISYHTSTEGNPVHPEFPGSCRTCLMPDTLNAECISYHKKRSKIKNLHNIGVNDGWNEDYQFISTPGHSPDSICVVFEDEVLFSGDTVLPVITPHPTLVQDFYAQRSILPESYRTIDKSYGLTTYITSLRKIHRQFTQTNILLPAHKLLENGQVNCLNPTARAAEIIDFHEERCRSIMNILGHKTTSTDEIASNLFDPHMLEGYGKQLGQREVLAHLELMATYGDIEWVDDHGFKARRTGSDNYRNFFSGVEA